MNPERKFRSHSTISLDSLENVCVNVKEKKIKNNIESYINKLVPLYDGDRALPLVLPGYLSNQKSRCHLKENTLSSKSSNRRKSYLQQFRDKMSSQFDGSVSSQCIPDLPESICPEFGDTDHDSIGSVVTSLSPDFFNTECYNEKLYSLILENRKTSNINFEVVPTVEDKYIKSASENDLVTVKVRIIDSARKFKSRQKSNLTSPYLDCDKIRNRIKIQEYSTKIRLENKMKVVKKKLSQSTDTVISNCKSECKETELKCHVNNKPKTVLPPISGERKQENKKDEKEQIKSDNNGYDRASAKSLKNIEKVNTKFNSQSLASFSKKVPNNLRSLRETHSFYKGIVGKMKLKL